jgi:hypothetical protein
MDLNRLYFDHQMQLIEAERAPSERLHRKHTVAAWVVAERIARIQRRLGAAAAPAWEALSSPARSSLAAAGHRVPAYVS